MIRHVPDGFRFMMEGIGKKYQWIAFHELLARVPDNYDFFQYSWIHGDYIPSYYNGPWSPYVRDIDPTILIKRIEENKFEHYWWFNARYDQWRKPPEEWVEDAANLPDPTGMINVKDPQGTEWLVLDIQCFWNNLLDQGNGNWISPDKELTYDIQSYITFQDEHDKIISFLKDKNLSGSLMPVPIGSERVFSREHYWAPAMTSFYENYYISSAFQNVPYRSEERAGEIAVTTKAFSWDIYNDGSRQSVIDFVKPSAILMKLLDLQYMKIEGQLCNTNGEMICFDPSVTHPTYSCLLVRKQDLLARLKTERLNIFWTTKAEKRIYENIVTAYQRMTLGETRGVLNPSLPSLNVSSLVTISEGNLQCSSHTELITQDTRH